MITNFNKFINESIRDKMTGVDPQKILVKLNSLTNPHERAEYIIRHDISSDIYGDDKEFINFLDDSIFYKIQTIRRLRNMEKISKEELEKEIDYTLGDDSIDDALFNIQGVIGQEWGDNAGMYFSGKEDNYWEQSSYIDRKVILNDYLDSEQLEEDEIIEESNTDEYFANYRYYFATGPNTHFVELFDKYTDERGLHGDSVFKIEKTRAADIVKEVRKYLTKEQMKVLITAMKEHQDIIILPSGKIGR